MRRLLTVLVLTSVVLCVPLPARPSETVTFSVIYGTLDLGTWESYASGWSKTGFYDGASFDDSVGPGFATVILSRLANAADQKGLYRSLKPNHMRLVVQARKESVVVSTVTCEKALPAAFEINGDLGSVPEVLTFACTKISATNAGPAAKPCGVVWLVPIGGTLQLNRDGSRTLGIRLEVTLSDGQTVSDVLGWKFNYQREVDDPFSKRGMDAKTPPTLQLPPPGYDLEGRQKPATVFAVKHTDAQGYTDLVDCPN
jgi:hypothetical protein